MRILPAGTAGTALLLAVVYALAWWGLLASGLGVFWDDWLLVDGAPSTLLTIYDQSGHPIHWVLQTLLLPFGAEVIRLLSFVTFYLSGLLMALIAKRIARFTASEEVLVGVIFLTVPLYAARNASLILLPNLIFFTCFLAAWLLIGSPRAMTSAPTRLAGALLFILSFSYAASLVLFAAPVAEIAIRARQSPDDRLYILRKFGWMLFLPPSFWLVMQLSFPTSGMWENYNVITTWGLISGAFIFIGAVVAFLLLIRLAKTQRWLESLAWGVFLVGLGFVPFLAVGKVSFALMNWTSRAQLALLPGVSLALAAPLVALLYRGLRSTSLSTLVVFVSASILVSNYVALTYWRDWTKQKAFIAAVQTQCSIDEASLVVIKDINREANVFARDLGYYEWNGLLNRAFNDESRFGVSTRGDATVLNNGGYEWAYVHDTLVGARDFQFTPVAAVVEWDFRWSGPFQYTSSLTCLPKATLEESIGFLPNANL